MVNPWLETTQISRLNFGNISNDSPVLSTEILRKFKRQSKVVLYKVSVLFLLLCGPLDFLLF